MKSCLWLMFYLINNLCWAMDPPFIPKESEILRTWETLKPFLNKNPESVLVYEKGQLTHKFAFMSAKSRNGVSFLAVKSVAPNNYQNAFFVSKSRIEKKEKDYTIDNFMLVPAHDGYFRIRCRHGEESFLAVKSMGKSGHQYAFFAPDKYLDQDLSYISYFKIVPVDEKRKTYFIQNTSTPESFLAISKVKDGSYSWAFFATLDYLKSLNPGTFSFDFALNP